MLAMAIVAAWRQWRRWFWWTTGGGGSSGSGGIGFGVSCSTGGGFRGNGSGGGECHDDGGMEEVVTWRLFMIMIFVVNLQVLVNCAEGSTGTHYSL
jgi:hypothetical protein